MTGYEITTDASRIPLDALHAALLRLYTCHAIPLPLLPRALANSLPFAALTPAGELAAFARVITDKAVSAHITAACVLESHRGRGLSQQIIAAILAHPDLLSVHMFSIESPANGFFTHCGLPLQAAAEPYGELRRPV